jgi:hypothetical protein
MNARTCHGEIYSGLALDLSGLDLEEIGHRPDFFSAPRSRSQLPIMGRNWTASRMRS